MAKGFIISNIIGIVIAGVLVAVYFKSTEKRMAFVKIGKVYDEFQMKKDLETKYTTVDKTRKNLMDSLELDLKLLSNKLEQGSRDQNLMLEFETKKQNYLLKKKQFEEDNNAMASQYTQQIMKQLNTYVGDYGKEKKFTYILGAEGSGVIMHADPSEDITEDVILYVNSKYKGQ